MCGRFVSSSPPDEIAAYFGADATDAELEPNYNVSPSSDVYVVFEEGSVRRVDAFNWGLIPSWAKDIRIGNKLINARSETVATKNAFRSSLSKRRCIVPVDSFYEWKAVEGQKKKQPYRIVRPDGEPFAMAGLWAQWFGNIQGQPTTVRSTTILTGEPNEEMARLHDRMPIILPPSSWDEWLDPDQTDVAAVGPLLVPAPKELITFHPVSTEVNNARNNGAHLIGEVEVPSVPESGAPDQQRLI